MNFDFSDEQKLLQQTARDFLAAQAPLATCREVLEGDAPYASALWKGAAEMGWQGAVIPEVHGGAGFGHLELAMIAHEVGRALAPIPFGPSVYVATEALLRFGTEAQQARWLPQLASGEAIGSYAFAEQPGQNAVEAVAAKVEHGRIEGVKAPVLDGGVATLVVVAARDAEGLGLFLVEPDAGGVTRTPLDSFDPSRPQARLELRDAPAERLEGADAEGVAALLDRAAVLTAFEQIGAAERAFEITREFILGRYAFGKPVAAFQAVKHRMADLWCEIELARSNAYYAAWALENEDPELAVAACLARIAASRAFENVSVDMIQLHGGVGFTWEYDCHLFYRRAKLLSAALGTPRHWKNLLIDRLQASQAA